MLYIDKVQQKNKIKNNVIPKCILISLKKTIPKKKPKLKTLINGPLTVYDAKIYITSRIRQEQLKCYMYMSTV